MRLMNALLAVAIVAALAAGATAPAASGDAAARKHRIAIDLVMNAKSDTGTFTLYPANPNTDLPDALAGDRGTASITGYGGGSWLLNGMRVWGEHHPLNFKGRHGTLVTRVESDSNDMQNGVKVTVGTWKIVRGTGAYAGFEGGGRYVAVQMPNGRRFVRQEGWVTR